MIKTMRPSSSDRADFLSYKQMNFINETVQNKHFFDGDVEPYLRKWTKEDEKKYQWRVDSTYYMNYVKPTVNGLSNILFRKSVKFEGIPEKLLVSVSKDERHLTNFMQTCSNNAIRDGFTLISAETTAKGESSNAQEEQENGIYGYLKNYESTQIVNYKLENERLKQITLVETVEEDTGVFSTETYLQYKVYRVGGGELFIKRHNGDKLEHIYSWENNLDFIPISILYMGSYKGVLNCKSYVSDIVKLNKAHYNLKSGIMNICHIASNPVPKLFGEITNTSFVIGVNEPLHFVDKESSDFLWEEISGSSVKIAENEIDKLEDYIYKQSFSILKDEPYQTATQARIENGKGRGVLTTFALNLESTFEKALINLGILTGENITPNITMNKDYDDILIDPVSVANIINLKEKGMLSLESLWDNLIRGEILKPDFDMELEKQRLESEEMMGLGGGGNDGR